MFTFWIRGDEIIIYSILFIIVTAVVRFIYVFGRHWPESLSYSGMEILMATFTAATAFELGSTRSEEKENRLGGRERKEGTRREGGRELVLGYLVFSP